MESSLIEVKEPARAFVFGIRSRPRCDRSEDDDDLLQTNVIEETFPLTVEESDMVPENFQSLNSIESFVSGKLGQTSGKSPPLQAAG